VITLVWDKKHPWDADLMAHGVTLVAEFKTQSYGLASQKLQSAAAAGQNRTLSFHLPAVLSAAPEGPVCLYFQTANQKILPIRKAGGSGGDASRFRYTAWETITVPRSRQRADAAKVNALKHEIGAKQAQLDKQEKDIAESKLTTVQACQNIPAPSFAAKDRPISVVDPSAQESVARRVCVSRVVWEHTWLLTHLANVPSEKRPAFYEALTPSYVLEPAVAAFLMRLPSDRGASSEIAQRQRQLVEYKRDWDQWAKSAPDYQPPLGGKTEMDFLEVQSTAAEVGKRLLPQIEEAELHTPHHAGASAQDIAGFVGASLEAYSRCVVDGKTELKTRYEAWVEGQQRAPELALRAQKQLIGECNARLATRDKTKLELDALQHQAALLGTTPDMSDVRQPYTPLQELNAVSCKQE
jgi:hypothetical protein